MCLLEPLLSQVERTNFIYLSERRHFNFGYLQSSANQKKNRKEKEKKDAFVLL